MKIEKEFLAEIQNNKKIYKFKLKNKRDSKMEVINYGCRITSIKIKNKDGYLKDVVLGYENIDDYLHDKYFFGAIIGRNSNRIENSEIDINGKTYKLNKNEGNNQLHGGVIGFDKVIWEYNIIEDENAINFLYVSADGEEGYPGNLYVSVKYTLTENDEVKIEYYAKSDSDTIVNLTNHSYFNLSGHESGNILEQQLMIRSNQITTNSIESIPNGEIMDISNTPFDFTRLKSIGKDIDKEHEQIQIAKGFDHNFIIDKKYKNENIVMAYSKETGIVMEVFTTKPGIQFYSGNYIENMTNCKEKAIYNKNQGFCLETQFFPNGIKHKNFPSPILKKNEEYKHTTIYKFSIIE